jgi:xanthine dehydrogenase YagR molybdenum-binding subunit
MGISIQQQAIGSSISRLDGPKKVTGTAKYAFEYDINDATYAFPVQSTIAKGRITSIDTSAAQAIPGVLMVLTHENAPHINSPLDAEFAVLQTNAVGYRGQFVALVVAETMEGPCSAIISSRSRELSAYLRYQRTHNRMIPGWK